MNDTIDEGLAMSLETSIPLQVRKVLKREGVDLPMAACRELGGMALRTAVIGGRNGMRKGVRDVRQGLSFFEKTPNSLRVVGTMAARGRPSGRHDLERQR